MTVEMLPTDEYNQELIANVHPPDWVNPEPSGKYNLVVIGAGTAGLVTAAGAAGCGAKVALIERHMMGGDCLNVGCVPSKGVISSARVAESARFADQFGVQVPDGVTVDFPKAMQRMRKLRAGISQVDSAPRFSELGIDVFLGQACFLDSNTVTVDGRELKFKKAVIATGARASAPAINGLDQVDYLTNESVFSLTELPARFGIIGAGPIGCEMAQSFASFGSEVHLIASMRDVLPREDRECANIVRSAMQRGGVNIHCCGNDTQIIASEDGIRMQFTSGEEKHDILADQLLVAAGRAPNVEGLELEKVGVDYSAKGVKVDDTFRTSNANIYAAGDICSPFQFTHAADFMARAVIQNALFALGPFGKKKGSSLTIPWCTYTTPELAHVGLSEAEAKKQNIEIDTYSQPFEHVDRAILDGETEGLVKVNCAHGTDKILGATIVAHHAGDMISEVALAMTHGLGLGKIACTIHPYPTQADAIRRTGDLYGRTRLTPRVKDFFTRWLAWQRR